MEVTSGAELRHSCDSVRSFCATFWSRPLSLTRCSCTHLIRRRISKRLFATCILKWQGESYLLEILGLPRSSFEPSASAACAQELTGLSWSTMRLVISELEPRYRGRESLPLRHNKVASRKLRKTRSYCIPEALV